MSGTKLDTPQIDDVFRAVIDLGAPRRRGQKCIVDLTDQTFINPAGMTGVVLAAHELKRRGWRPVVAFPAADEVAGYLCYMGLDAALDGIAECTTAEGPHHAGQSDVLLEMTRVAGASDVNAVRVHIHNRVSEILRTQLKYQPKDVSAFANVISELAQNVVDHSTAAGFVAAQTYRGARRRFVSLSVADTGIGLRASLSERFAEASEWSDVDVITNALRPEFSRFASRGMGLHFVTRACLKLDGTLQIRTGRTRLYVRSTGVRAFAGAEFPGTQISISFVA